MSPPPVLEVEQLSKRFGAKLALDSVDLRIAPGEIFALLGPNGAGKTTLIGAVCGTVKKSSGKIQVLGVDIDQDPVKPRFALGLVPQEVNFDPFFTAREVLHIQAGYYGQPKDEARVDEVLRALALWEKADAPTRTLSGGMKRRLLIAKALVHRPKLLFLDEPTAGVDVELRRDLWAYVRRLRNEGTTIVLTTHYLEEAEELSDRVGILDNGRLVLVEDTKALVHRLGERRLEVQLARPLHGLPEALVQWGASLSPDGCRVTYAERPGGTPAAQVLGALYAEHAQVLDVETRRARLEEVLLQILRGPATRTAREDTGQR